MRPFKEEYNMARPDSSIPPPPPPPKKKDSRQTVIFHHLEPDLSAEKLPEHQVMAEAAQRVAATAAELDAPRAPSMWMYVIAVILALFLLAMVLLAAVASSPGTAGN
jgi:hypothetical protein